MPRWARWASAALALVFATAVRASDDVALTAGREAALAANERLRFTVGLAEGEFLHVEVEQRGTDVSLTLIAPNGDEVWTSDDWRQATESEWAFWVAQAAGPHVLVVENKGRGTGSVRVAVVERRPATADDRRRAQFEGLLSRAEVLRVTKTREGLAGCVDLMRQGVQLLDAPGAGSLDERRHAAFTRLGICQRDAGRNAEAREAFLQALAADQRRGDDRRRANALMQLGNLSGREGEFREAARFTEEAVAFYRQTNEPSFESYALMNVGWFYSMLGQTRRGIESFEQSIDRFRQARNPVGEMQARANLGEAYRRVGNADAALASLEPALAAARELRKPDDEAGVLNTMAGVFGDLGDWAAAGRYAESAIELRHAARDAAGESSARTNLAEALIAAGDRRRAEAELGTALALCRAAGDRDREAWTLYVLGRALRPDRPAAGLERWQEALRIRQETGAVAEEAWLRAAIGEAQAESGADARAQLTAALAAFRSIAEPHGEAHALYLLARLEQQLGHQTAAIANAEAAIASAESVRARVVSSDLRASYQAEVRPYFELLMELTLGSEASLSDPALVERAFGLSEQARARALLDLLAAAAVDLDAALDPDLRSRRDELEAEISSLQRRLVSLGATSASREAARAAAARLDRAFDEHERLGQEIRRRNPRYGDMVYPDPGNLAEARRLAVGGAVILEYFVGERTSFLFVVTADGAQVHRLPGRRELETRVRVLRDVLSTPRRLSLGTLAVVAHELYLTLLAPAEGQLKAGTSVLVAPDGPLYGIPFEVLLTRPVSSGTQAGGWRYFLRDHEVRYLPSVAVLRQLAPPVGRSRLTLFAAGDPLLEQAATPPASPGLRALLGQAEFASLTPLPGSRREVEALSRLFPAGRTHVLLGKDASEEAVKHADLADARYVHFATHGLVSERRPAESGLVLARAGPAEDGFLQVHEILGLKLKADLVTLSACRSGLGRELPGEGLLGLAQAFFFAGARSMVVTLWSLTDESSPRLMVPFYAGLAAGESPAHALRAAKLAMLRDPRFLHPHHWAPFVLVGGDPR